MQRYKIGVFMGGKSIEREVSFNSGRTVCDHLDTIKYNVIPLFQSENGDIYILPLYFLHRGKIADFRSRLEAEAEHVSWDNLKKLVDFIYIAVHGRYAEDGTLQGMLEVLSIPYLGAKVFGSAIGMNKSKQKDLLNLHDIDVPIGVIIKHDEIYDISKEDVSFRIEKAGFSLPCVIKPVHEGSSLGISIIYNQDDLLTAIKAAATIDRNRNQDVIVEEKIEGMEFVCTSMQQVYLEDGVQKDEWFSLPITEVIPEDGTDFFDYEQKYMPGRATKITPARCSEQNLANVYNVCHKVAQVLHFSTISRIDGILTGDGRVVIIDPNTLTGMGPSTFLFHQAAEFDMSHSQLINFLIETEMKRYGLLSIEAKSDNYKGTRVVESAEKKIRVAVLFGGDSNEREISLESGRNVCYKLSPYKYDVIPIFVNEKMELFKLSQKLLVKNSTREIVDLVISDLSISWAELKSICDFVFIALHGGKGENGSVQGALEMLEIPYNGPGVLTSALCTDKCKTNSYLKNKGFNVPAFIFVDKKEWMNSVSQKKTLKRIKSSICFPMIVKPHDEGCSIFVEKVKNESVLLGLITKMFDFGKKAIMVEEFVQGMELTCGVYGNDEVTVFPPSQVVAKDSILSFQEKFLPGAGQNITPALLDDKALVCVKKTIKEVYLAVGCKGYSRIDCFYQDEQQSSTGKSQVVILEINTLPALTPATCLFHQAAEVGMKPMELVDKIVELGMLLHMQVIKKNR